MRARLVMQKSLLSNSFGIGGKMQGLTAEVYSVGLA